MSGFKNIFSFLFSRGSAEEHVARYVVREHERGRSLTEILEDKYVQNRLTPEQQRRLLDRPEIIEAFCGDVLESAKASLPRLEVGSDAALAREPHGLGAEGDVPRREPVRLEDDDVVVRLTPGDLAGDDLVELVHLEPVEHAGLHRLDEIARLELRLLEPVAADEARTLEHRVVELAARHDVGAGRHDERPRLEPLAAQHGIARAS